MARGIGTRALAGGHSVKLIGKERAQTEELGEGAEAADAVSGDVVVLAVYYPDALAAVEEHAGGARGQGRRRHHQPGERRLQRPGRATALASARYLEEAGFLHINLQERLGTGFGSALKVIS